MHRGNIYFVSLNFTRGYEQQDMRPVLIVSPGAFNLVTDTSLIINGGGFVHSRGSTVLLTKAETITTSVVLFRQVRTLDIEARHGWWVVSVSPKIMDDALARLATLVN